MVNRVVRYQVIQQNEFYCPGALVYVEAKTNLVVGYQCNCENGLTYEDVEDAIYFDKEDYAFVAVADKVLSVAQFKAKYRETKMDTSQHPPTRSLDITEEGLTPASLIEMLVRESASFDVDVKNASLSILSNYALLGIVAANMGLLPSLSVIDEIAQQTMETLNYPE